MTLRDTLTALLQPVVEGLGYELWELEYQPGRGRGLLRIYIDREARSGITVDDCERASRAVSDVLDARDPIPGNYTLEVSSPGIERPLRTPAHFDRFRGEEAAVVTNQKILGRLNHSGIIAEVSPEAVILDQPDLGRTEIRYTEIKKAHLKCDPWQMVRAAARQKQS